MKKVIAILLVLAISMTFFACGTSKDGGAKGDSKKESTVMKNDTINIDGIYVDKSYVDDEGPLKMVYLFLTITAKDANVKADCKYTEMKIGDNTYKSDFYKHACEYAPSYYYSSFIEDVYIGETLKLVMTFKVPEAELTSGKDVTLTDDAMPFDDIKFTTEEIVFCESVEEVCEKGDPEGYAEEIVKHEPADEATVKKVKKEINGYYWTFYVSAGSSVQVQEIEFSSPNKFEMRTNFGSNGGTYEIKNGYIYVTYSTNNQTYKIPYEFEDGEIVLYCEEAFSIYE